MRRATKILGAVLLVAVALMIVAPRVWVKNKKSRLVYDGHVSEKIQLFHGSNGRLLFYIGDSDPDAAFIYTASAGLWNCGRGSFVRLKLIAVNTSWHASCGEVKNGAPQQVESVDSNAIHFVTEDHIPVIVSWQDAPR